MKICVIGSGAFGFAIAHRLHAKSDNQVIIWSESQKKIDEYQNTGSIAAVLGGRELPAGLQMSCSYQECLSDTDLVIVLTTSDFVESVCKSMLEYLEDKTIVAIGTKGACSDGSLPPIIAQDVLKRDIAMFAGPGFAVDILDDVPVGFTFATISDKAYEIASKAFSHDSSIKLDRSYDMVGVSLCSCIKNAAALCCGVLEGAKLPISTQCLLMQRILNDEISILRQIEGSDPATTISLAGVGDLILTCFSPKSRNSSYGRLVGEFGVSSNEAVEYISSNTVEGMSVIKMWFKTADKLGVESEFMNVATCAFGEEAKGIDALLEYIGS